MKLKSVCLAKKTINNMKTQRTEWENIFANTSDRGLISKIYKILQNSTPKQETIQLKMGKGPE